jgi:hypothetical protein
MNATSAVVVINGWCPKLTAMTGTSKRRALVAVMIDQRGVERPRMEADVCTTIARADGLAIMAQCMSRRANLSIGPRQGVHVFRREEIADRDRLRLHRPTGARRLRIAHGKRGLRRSAAYGEQGGRRPTSTRSWQTLGATEHPLRPDLR